MKARKSGNGIHLDPVRPQLVFGSHNTFGNLVAPLSVRTNGTVESREYAMM